VRPFNLIPKEYLKLLAELVVIFLSVVLAFFFDDYREKRSQREQYKSDLTTFNSELLEVIGNIHGRLDSFRVSSDPYRGSKLYELLDLVWLDSLVDQRKATMADFRYIIRTHYIDAFRPDFKMSPLANEIRIKYSAQAAGGNVLNWLSRYQEEVTNHQVGNGAVIEAIQKVIATIDKTSPDLEFDKQDSLLLYSKEARWSFKKVMRIQKDMYNFEKYLAQDRLMQIASGINNELLALGVETTWNPDCQGLDFKKRYECEYGKSIKDEDIMRISDVVVRERNEFLKERRR